MAVLEKWIDRKIITPDQAKNLATQLRSRSFSLAKVWEEQALQAVKDLVEQAIKNGMTMREFKDQASAILPRFENGWYSELVRRVNTTSAAAAGKYEEMLDERYATAWAYWRYIAITDSRNISDEECPDTRCRWLHGRVFRKDDMEARYFLPPLHFQCRCQTQEVGQEMLDQRGWTVTPGSAIPFRSIPGWGGASILGGLV